MSYITSSIHEGLLSVSFHDPATRNSFSVRAAEELCDLLGSPSAQRAQAIVFTSRGRVFCSGGNLSDYAVMNAPEEGKEVNRRITQVLGELSRFPKPTVCAVGGDCFGGGVELMSAFDFVISVPHAMFGLWQRRIGLSFGWGGGKRLEARMGLHRLRELAISARSFSAFEAKEFGLIDRIVPLEALGSVAFESARALVRLPELPVTSLKSWTASEESKIFEGLWWNEEHRGFLKSRKS